MGRVIVGRVNVGRVNGNHLGLPTRLIVSKWIILRNPDSVIDSV